MTNIFHEKFNLKKLVYFSKTDAEKVNKIMQENGLSSFSATVRFLVRRH
jgi:hypothetical protein